MLVAIVVNFIVSEVREIHKCNDISPETEELRVNGKFENRIILYFTILYCALRGAIHRSGKSGLDLLPCARL